MLRRLCALAGLEVVPEAEAGALWVSLCDPSDLPVLVSARAQAAGRPVVMGGFEGYFGLPYLAWADMVCVGEGAEFVAAWGRGGPEAAAALPCTLVTAGERTVVPSYAVPYPQAPLLRLPGRERYYYLAARGCRGRCAFCASAWCQPRSQAPLPLVRAALRHVAARRGSITLITNDGYDGLPPGVRVNSGSVRVADYLHNPGRYRGQVLHFGVEGWTEAERRQLGKPLSAEAVRELLRVTAARRQQCELFFIVGQPGWSLATVESFAAELEPSASDTPRVYVKLTYLDPCPHTPLAGLAVDTEYCDCRAVFRILNAVNKRVRVFPTRSAARSAWRTVLHRATAEEALRLGPEPDGANRPEAFERFVAALQKRGLAHLLNSEPAVHRRIAMPSAAARMAGAARWQ